MQSFVSDIFESARDGVVEFYEFVDAVLVTRKLRAIGDFTRESLSAEMQDMRKGRKAAPERLWTWDEDGNSSDPALYGEWKGAFKSLDLDRDGVLDAYEVRSSIL